MNILRLSAFAATLIGAAVVWLAPATLLERSAAGNSLLRLEACSGRLLGSGNCRVYLPLDDQWVSLGELSFDWRYRADGGPQIALMHDGTPIAQVRPTLAGWSAIGADWASRRLPVESLPSPISVLRPAGWLRLSLPKFECNWLWNDCTGRVLLELRDLVLGRREAAPIGSYQLEFVVGPDGGVTGELRTLTGPVGVEGRFSTVPKGRIQAAGRIRLGAGTAVETTEILATLAERESADSFRFSFHR